jgi:hypothetical protein
MPAWLEQQDDEDIQHPPHPVLSAKGGSLNAMHSAFSPAGEKAWITQPSPRISGDRAESIAFSVSRRTG